MFQRMNHPSEGELRYISPAARYQATPAAVRLPGPRLSQHTDELLTSVGYFAKRIATLRSAGVIA